VQSSYHHKSALHSSEIWVSHWSNLHFPLRVSILTCTVETHWTMMNFPSWHIQSVN
jgi:hypothetical protein